MKHKRRKKMRDTRGITLIALVITIVVLLILAGVAINLTIGDNGIFKKSDEGAQEADRTTYRVYRGRLLRLFWFKLSSIQSLLRRSTRPLRPLFFMFHFDFKISEQLNIMQFYEVDVENFMIP